MKTWRLVAVLTVVLAGVLWRTHVWLEALPPLAGGCGEDLITSVPSPDQKYMAAVFIRNCGATTPYVTHVNLRASNRPFAVTQAETIVEGTVFEKKGREPVKLIWKDATHLLIQCPLTEVYEQHRTWKEVMLSYRGGQGDPAWMVSIKHQRSGAVLHRVPAQHLEGADLRGANLKGADLRRANLCFARLRGANLRNADLHLEGADLVGAAMEGTLLTGARYGIRYDNRTQWPEGFDPQSHGAVQVE
jgi:hypothetical protein